MTDTAHDTAITLTRPTVSASLATALIAAAERASVAAGLRMSLAVIDESGLLKAFHRMDGASFTSGSVAQDKAFSAASGRPTHAWHAALEADAVLGAGARSAIPRLVTLGGGYPVIVAGELVGGLGVSGGHYTQDMDVAVAALAEIGARSDW
ncbi:heme-binding protein [Pseudonocardia nematodicida]|uniref:Heme-binding protein n=1 Tax=Pseudonocardia nematodicida TaxID=1206997 RepID=A0ABV1K5N4_9PSEU